MLRSLRFTVAALLAASAFGAAAQYPTKPIRLVVPFGAGGPTDLVARTTAENMQKRLGQNILVENRPGDAGMIAHRYAAQQPHDGYNLLFSADSLVLYPVLFKSWDLDMLQAFSYIGTVTQTPTVIMAPNQAPYKTVGEFIKYAKANPGKVNYAFIGPGPHAMVLRYMNRFFDLKMTEVIYKSVPEAKAAAARGDVHLYYDGYAGASDAAARPIVILAPKRTAEFPNVPTPNEGDLAPMKLSVGQSWSGIMAPAGTPPEAISRLNAALNETLRSPEWIERARNMGATGRPTDPAEFRALVARDAAQWARVAKEINMQPQ